MELFLQAGWELSPKFQHSRALPDPQPGKPETSCHHIQVPLIPARRREGGQEGPEEA